MLRNVVWYTKAALIGVFGIVFVVAVALLLEGFLPASFSGFPIFLVLPALLAVSVVVRVLALNTRAFSWLNCRLTRNAWQPLLALTLVKVVSTFFWPYTRLVADSTTWQYVALAVCAVMMVANFVLWYGSKAFIIRASLVGLFLLSIVPAVCAGLMLAGTDDMKTSVRSFVADPSSVLPKAPESGGETPTTNGTDVKTETPNGTGGEGEQPKDSKSNGQVPNDSKLNDPSTPDKGNNTPGKGDNAAPKKGPSTPSPKVPYVPFVQDPAIAKRSENEAKTPGPDPGFARRNKDIARMLADEERYPLAAAWVTAVRDPFTTSFAAKRTMESIAGDVRKKLKEAEDKKVEVPAASKSRIDANLARADQASAEKDTRLGECRDTLELLIDDLRELEIRTSEK